MPIKVNCGKCEAAHKVSEQAAGKSIKCRECGARIRVPGGSGESSRPRRRSSAASASANPDDVFSGINLGEAEDRNRKVCPNCASAVRDEDIECSRCGVNIATGALSERQRIRRERQGPPPEEFYEKVWSNAWKFLKKHKSYAVRTAVIWAVCISMAVTCGYSLNYYVTSRTADLLEKVKAANAAEVRVEGSWIVITVPEGKGSKVDFDGKFYQQNAVIPGPSLTPWREPPSWFWSGMTAVFSLGFGGWFWTLATAIASTTMAGEKKIKRFQFDFFANLTLGVRFYAWPTILMLPLLVIPAGLAQMNPMVSGIIAGVLLIFPVLALPAAVVHMAQNYSYRAWLLSWMGKDLGRTFAASMYVFGMMFGLVLLIPGAIAGAAVAMSGRLSGWLLSQEAAALDWLKANIMDMGDGNFQFLMYRMPLVFSASFVSFGLLFLLIAFPLVFMFRVIGLYGLYFRADLSLTNEFADFEQATFGPRYLAFLVDLIIMALFVIPGLVIGQFIGFMAGMYNLPNGALIANVATGLASLVLWGMYFTFGESGAARATLGKWSIGTVVLRDDNLPLDRNLAMKRACWSLLSLLVVFLPFLSCIFRKDLKALQDQMTKTKVVWQPEQN